MLVFLLPYAALLWTAAPLAAADTVSIRSSLDGSAQPALVALPAAADRPAPLLVHLHSWSATFDKSGELDVAMAEAARRQWAFISPDFRGPNDRPEACGSELSVQDVLDAVDWMKKRARIDERRIYLLGSSGGGYMTLVMAGRAPQLWAAASAWVPISDLPAWYEFSKQKNSRYWKMLEGCFGGGPTHGMAVQQYRRRSPLFFLAAARGLPLDINTGIQDGHTGSVPVSHAIRAFNVLAPPSLRVPETTLDEMVRDARVPGPLRVTVAEQRKRPVLFRRAAGPARLTIFDGGHEGDFAAAIRWLETHVRPEWTLGPELQDYQVLQRDARGEAVLPVAPVPGLQVRVNGGPWSRRLPAIKTGGPYTIEFRKGAASARREHIYVGDLYLLAGQSNMVGRAALEGATPPDPRVHALTPADVWEVARDPLHESRAPGMGAGLGVPFGKEMVRRNGVPVGLIPCAVGGTSLEQWDPSHAAKQFRRSLYGNCIARARLAGGRFAALLWYQGENDAGKLETARTYLERFARLMENFRSDLNQPGLPVLFAQLSRHAAAGGEDGWNLVQEAQRKADSVIPDSGMVATVDLTLGDPIHLDRPSLERLGRRFAERLTSGPGPDLASATWDSPTRLRLKFTRRVRPDGERIHGFSLSAGQVYHARQEDATGDIILFVTRPDAGNTPVELWYGRGRNPVCNLRDARDLALPVFGPILVK